jgi:hypothetical protein
MANFMEVSCQDSQMSEDLHSSTIVGWREWVSLPGIGIPWLKAKLDTGARSSALHAIDVEEVAGGERVRFTVQPWQQSTTAEPCGVPPATKKYVTSCSWTLRLVAAR